MNEIFISFTAIVDACTFIDRSTGEKRTKTVKLRFLDTIKFMNGSLAALTSNFSSHPHLESHFKEDASLLQCKRVYPYEYITSEIA